MPRAHFDQLSLERAATTTDIATELRDVNERLIISGLREREASEVAKCEREQLHALIEAMHDGVVIAGGDGRIVMLNDAARRLIGSGPIGGDNAGLPIVTALDIRRLDMTPLTGAEQPVTRAMRGDVLVDAEMLLVRPNGEVRNVLTSCTSTMEDGHVALAITVFRDVTERRELEERLAQVERLAAVGTLAAGVAHEINNPLAYVMSNVELVIEELRTIGATATATSPSLASRMMELEKMLLEAQVGADRVGKIVRSLRTFSRSEDEPRAVIDVRPVIELAVAMTFNETRHRARVVKEYGPTPFIEADAAQLGQVFINLLLNAAHALPKVAGQSSEIRIVTSTDAAGKAVIEIRDNGHGIADEILPHIFDPFFTTNSVGNGSGLGLPISRNIVLALGGELEVKSQKGADRPFASSCHHLLSNHLTGALRRRLFLGRHPSKSA